MSVDDKGVEKLAEEILDQLEEVKLEIVTGIPQKRKLLLAIITTALRAQAEKREKEKVFCPIHKTEIEAVEISKGVALICGECHGELEAQAVEANKIIESQYGLIKELQDFKTTVDRVQCVDLNHDKLEAQAVAFEEYKANNNAAKWNELLNKRMDQIKELEAQAVEKDKDIKFAEGIIRASEAAAEVLHERISELEERNRVLMEALEKIRGTELTELNTKQEVYCKICGEKQIYQRQNHAADCPITIAVYALHSTGENKGEIK